ncbi:hypothetical protein RND71_034447 [Anisodus tanguticus]|uniref:Uncharacterized protein n=1 Tax=Anisodus tanguticus TaxID=243964 RepID=A0AAE1RBF1_9SOLA|nr:hypothetical protein RND71_034447 [Anisodus tanguticus]
MRKMHVPQPTDNDGSITALAKYYKVYHYSQPWTPAMSQTRAHIPTSTPAPALSPSPAPDHDLQPENVDMMCRIMIMHEGAGLSVHGIQKTLTRLLRTSRRKGAQDCSGESVDGVQVAAMAQQIAQLNPQLLVAEARRLEGERAMQESVKSLDTSSEPHCMWMIWCALLAPSTP